MHPEIETYSKYLHEKIEQIHAALGGLSEEDLNRAPLPGANSPFVIATHTYGNMRAWVLGIACGQVLRRDRPGEFASRGTYAQLTEHARELSQSITDAVKSLDPARMDDRFTPSQELFGEGPLRELSRREGLLHPIEHASIHLGHIQVTLDMLRAGHLRR